MAASARDWPDRVHRFLLDHGGASVRARVMSASEALETQYEVLLIDDICSFLTPRLVRRLRDQEKDIVGVFSPQDGPDAKRRLLECGVTDVIESNAGPEEFLKAVVAATGYRGSGQKDRRPRRRASGYRIGVRSAATGSGATEVAIGIASRIGLSRPVTLVDFDQQHPGLAHRLDLPVHPNLRTAVDLAHHDPDRLEGALLGFSDLLVVGGLATGSEGDPFRAGELIGLLEELAAIRRLLVLDMGDSPEVRGLTCDIEVMVGEASPVGLARLLHALEDQPPSGPERVAVVNRAPAGRRRDDIRVEMERALGSTPAVVLPEDDRVRRAAWDGVLVGRGRFAAAIERFADLILAAVPT